MQHMLAYKSLIIVSFLKSCFFFILCLLTTLSAVQGKSDDSAACLSGLTVTRLPLFM